jgi:hypothetical protein
MMSFSLVCRGLIPPVALAAVAATHLQAQAQAFSAQQLGDTELTCQQLYDEVKSMDALIASNAPAQAAAPTSEAGQAAKAFSNLAAHESRTAEAAQIGGLFQRLTAGLAGGASPQQIEANKALARQSAQARKQYLTATFNSKKCKVSALRK